MKVEIVYGCLPGTTKQQRSLGAYLDLKPETSGDKLLLLELLQEKKYCIACGGEPDNPESVTIRVADVGNAAVWFGVK